MTRKEAIELQSKCDKIMSDVIDEKCMVSMTLSSNLKVSIGDNYITFSLRNGCNPEEDYVSYLGSYDELACIVERAKKCLVDNFYDFNQLMWSYRHIDELVDEEDECEADCTDCHYYYGNHNYNSKTIDDYCDGKDKVCDRYMESPYSMKAMAYTRS